MRCSLRPRLAESQEELRPSQTMTGSRSVCASFSHCDEALEAIGLIYVLLVGLFILFESGESSASSERYTCTARCACFPITEMVLTRWKR